MKKRTLCLFLAILMLIMCMLPACGEVEETAEETTEVKKVPVRDPAEDGVLNIMMVGNSFCYYYVEELYQLLKENPPEGIGEINIYNLYYSGCSLTRHLEWFNSGTGEYDLYKTNSAGRSKLGSDQKWILRDAMAQADWDYISLQGSITGANYLGDDIDNQIELAAKTAEPLLDFFHEEFPTTQLLWHRTWFSEVGRVSSSNYTYTEKDGPKYDANMQKLCDYMCDEFDKNKPYDLIMVNSGAAWTKARELNKTADVLPYGGLCARLGMAKFGDNRANAGDGYHDGDIGGAQLLNAYVWYMLITGDTDLSDNVYKPVYSRNGEIFELSDAHIALLKEAAMSVYKK